MCHALMTLSQHLDYAILWILSFFAALTVVTGKLGHRLFGIAENPPEDPEAARHWHRRRRWLLVSEFSALPACASIALVATIYYNLPPAVCVGLSMAMGALGFGFLLNGIQYLARLKLARLEKDLT